MLLREGQFSPRSTLSTYLSWYIDRDARCLTLFFEKPHRFIQGSQKFGLFISVTRHGLTQGAFKKFVKRHFDRIEIGTCIGFQEAVTD
jgi:hypothetical protein